jgi:hypothetical protein
MFNRVDDLSQMSQFVSVSEKSFANTEVSIHQNKRLSSALELKSSHDIEGNILH